MLLLAQEQKMYEKMRKRDLCRKMYAASASAAFGFLWLWGIGAVDDTGIYDVLLCMTVFFVSLVRYRKIKGEILPVSGCLLRLEGEQLFVRQPGKYGRYEECIVFLSEISAVVPSDGLQEISFYLVLIDEDTRKSRIGMEGENNRKIFCVQGRWYDRKKFISLYRCFLQRLPEHVPIGGGSIPVSWRRSTVDFYHIFLWMLPVFFLLPVIVQIF